MAKARTRAQKKPPVTAEEKSRVRAMKLVGLDGNTIGKDEFGRDRMKLIATSRRDYDIGTMKSVVRVRNVDPLAGMSSLTWQQKKAGAKYREDFEVSASEGLKTSSWERRVDGGSGDRDRPERITIAMKRLYDADEKLAHQEIRRIVACVCGAGMSVKAIAERERNPRDVVAKLLGVGLDILAVYYGVVPDSKRVDR